MIEQRATGTGEIEPSDGTEGIWREYPWVRIAARHPVGDRSYVAWMHPVSWMENSRLWDYGLPDSEQDFDALIEELEDAGLIVPFSSEEAREAFAAGEALRRLPHLSPGGVSCFIGGEETDGLEEGLELWARCAVSTLRYTIDLLEDRPEGGVELAPGRGLRVWLVGGEEVAEGLDLEVGSGYAAYIVAERALDVTDAAERVLARRAAVNAVRYALGGGTRGPGHLAPGDDGRPGRGALSPTGRLPGFR